MNVIVIILFIIIILFSFIVIWKILLKKKIFFNAISCSYNFNTITDKRNRLDPETVQATICLKSWIDNQFCQKNIDVEMKKF